MYRTVNWQEEIATIAGPIQVRDSRESWLLRAARKAQITHWHAQSLFYGKMIDPKWSIGINVVGAAEDVRWEAAGLDKVRCLNTLETVARGMINANQTILGKDAAEMLNAARILRGLDLSRNNF